MPGYAMIAPRRALGVFFVIGIVVARTLHGQSDPSTGTVSVSTPDPYTSPYIGVTGTAGATAAACPFGKVVIGVAGSRAKFISKITPICASVNKDGSFSSVAAVDPGAISAGVFRLECAPGRVVTRLRVAYHTNTAIYPFLGAVEIGCSPWASSQWSGTPLLVASTGFDGWPVKAAVVCTNQTQPMRSLGVRATTAVKMLSIGCSQL